MEIDYSRQEFEDVFGFTFEDLKDKFDDIYLSGVEPKANALTRRFIEENKLDFLFPEREDLKTYYMSDAYAYLLIKNGIKVSLEENPFDQFEIKMILHLLQRWGGKYADSKVLLYGCGMRLHPLALKKFGFEITFADIPHKSFKFLQRVVPDVSFLSITSDEPLIEEYDYIICREVLEHVLEPEQTLEHLVAHLKPKKFIFLSTFFDDMRGQDPSHLRRNTIRYAKDEIWYPIVRSKGLEVVLYNEEGTPKIWRKM